MDRSDDLTRSRRFNALELGSERTRPKIITTKDERVAPGKSSAGNRPPQPSLEFRARQRLRTYAEAATVMDRQTPRDASSARSQAGPAPAGRAEAGYGSVIPEPPSPMAEAYVGRSPQLTQREAAQHNLTPANDLVVPADAYDNYDGSDDLSPDVSAYDAAVTANQGFEPAITAPAFESHADEQPDASADLGFDTDDIDDFDFAQEEAADQEALAYQSPSFADPGPDAEPAATANHGVSGGTSGGVIGKTSGVIGTFTSKSALVAKSLVANADSLWQNVSQRGVRLAGKIPGVSTMAAQSGAGVIDRVSHLPANSLLTPQMGSLAASARADASHARPDANVRPVQNDGVLQQEPEPRRTLQARKIQDNVERTESRAIAPAGPISQTKQGRMAFSSLALIVITLVLLAAAAWATLSIMQRTSNPISTIGQTERYRIEAVLDALFINPGPVDGVIDDRTVSAIAVYATEYGYSGSQTISAGLLQHLEDEAEAMGVLDLIK